MISLCPYRYTTHKKPFPSLQMDSFLLFFVLFGGLSRRGGASVPEEEEENGVGGRKNK